MKKLDEYIVKKFLGTFIYALGLIILIVIIFDFSEKIDDFIEKEAPIREIIFTYYLNFIPFFVNLFSPLFTFISVIFFTSRLAMGTEIVAMLSSGISFRRLLIPYLGSALLVGLASLFLANIIIPPASKKRLDFEATYVKDPTTFRDRNIHMQIRPGVFIYLESYNEHTNLGWRFSLEQVVDGKLVYKLSGDNVRFDSINGSWAIENYFIRTIDGMKEELSFGHRLDTILPLTPHDFTQNLREMETMNFTELRNYIRTEKLRGSENVKFYEVEFYRRLAFPLATTVLTLIGMALSSRKVRGGIGLHIGAGLGLSFAFILFMQVSTTFATNGNLHPAVSVAIPNIVFGIIGLYLYKTAPK